MKKLDIIEMEFVSGGRFWTGFCSGFALGNAGLAVVGISLGPVGAAAYTSVMAGCAIHTVIRHGFR